MKRGGWLKRKTRLRPIGRTSHARRERQFWYVEFVRTLPCIARLLVTTGFECQGEIEANHVGGRYGKDTDLNTIPMCHKHHEHWTGIVGGGGLFAGWSVERRREWGAKAIAATRLAYNEECPF